MSSTLVLIDVLGAAALLLWGLRLIKTGMLRAFGASLRYVIGRATSNPIKAVGAGLVTTFALQSSTATAVIAASFAARAILTAPMAQAVMLGANVGTGLVAALLSIDLHLLSPLLIIIGVAAFSRANNGRTKGIARTILGLGLMLLSLSLMSEATEPVRNSQTVIVVLSALSEAPVIGLLLAAGLACLASSSLAVVLFAVLLGQAEIITPQLALVIVAGANLGGAVPPWLAVLGEGIEAKRLALTNLGIRALGAIVLTLAAPAIAQWAAPAPGDTGQLILYAHISFSVVLLVLFLPLVGPLAKLVERLMPSASVQTFGPRYLDEALVKTPALAIPAATRETLRLGDLVREMLDASLCAMETNDPAAAKKIADTEREIDILFRAIQAYLMRLRSEAMNANDARRAKEVLAYAVNLEHIGDIVENGLSNLATRKARQRINFSLEGREEIRAFHLQTLDVLQMAQTVFLSRDPDLARELAAAKSDVRRIETESATRHLDRLRARRAETIDTSGMHLDVLRDLKRVNAHLISVAYPILDEMGALRETRLRSK